LTYDVEFDDCRDEALNSLTDEERESIKETFQRYDIDGDNGISKPEVVELIKVRTNDRRAAIEYKFQEFIAEQQSSNEIINDEVIKTAERNKAQYFQQLRESQIKLTQLFEAADSNGDGIISYTEFLMAEAWWLRCSLNPEKAHLF
jgi:Ca2+-binding EF-hand superfamily protein